MNDCSKYMCFMISGDRIAFDSRRCDIIFPIKSVETTYSLKGDVSYLYEGKTKELSKLREREREFAKPLTDSVWSILGTSGYEIWLFQEKWLNCFCKQWIPDQTPHSIISIWLFFFVVERDIRHQVTVIDSRIPGPIINHPGLDLNSVDTFQRVRFCLPCQMKCIHTLILEALSISSRRYLHFFFLFSCVNQVWHYMWIVCCMGIRLKWNVHPNFHRKILKQLDRHLLDFSAVLCGFKLFSWQQQHVQSDSRKMGQPG